MKRGFFLFSVFSLATASSAFALDAKIRALMRDMDCVTFRVTDIRQKGAMLGEVAVWLIVNEGPTDVKILASNGDVAATFDVYNGNADVFVGDERYTYTIGLASKGDAKVHVCQVR